MTSTHHVRAISLVGSAFLLVAGVAACGSDDAPSETSSTTSTSSGGGCLADADCDAGLPPCIRGVCGVDGVCTSRPADEGSACDDGDPCTEGEHCSGNTCAGADAVDCAHLDQGCSVGVCVSEEGGCVERPAEDGIECDDDDLCTQGEVCVDGACTGTPTDCSALTNRCEVGVCRSADGECEAAPANEGGSCNDGRACWTGELCVEGVCGGFSEDYILFREDFSSTDTGWTLGPEWEIGPTQPWSPPDPPPPSVGNPDPEIDHTEPGDDDGIAGVVIGGTPEWAVHELSALESPPIDATVTPGRLFLSFARVLNTFNTPLMANTVDVWDGEAWRTVWNDTALGGPTPPGAIQDTEWTFQQYEITDLKNDALRVRFGFSISSLAGAPNPVGSWNVDDVAITAGPCEKSGFCTTAAPVLCQAVGECAVGVCDERTGGCENLPVEGGTLCEGGCGVCDRGACEPVSTQEGGPCAGSGVDACNSALCEDGECVVEPRPDDTYCGGGTFDDCTAGACQGGFCVQEPINDGLPCGGVDVPPCMQGVCAGGECELEPRPDDSPCDAPGGECSTGTCEAGECVVTDEEDGTPCFGASGPCNGVCFDGGCEDVPQEDGTICYFGGAGPCEGGACASGECEGPVPLDDGATCFDGLVCTQETTCSSGICGGGEPTDCSGLDGPCVVGACSEDPPGTIPPGCFAIAVADGEPCSGAICVEGSTCDTGECQGGTAVPPSGTLYFAEDFSDNSAGWTLGDEWEIGSATASPQGPYGFPDPAIDTSPTSDNGVAGVVIGGDASVVRHGPEYLLSPAIDTAVAADTVYLTYNRWLNSDYEPFTISTVEVFDGDDWVVLWRNGGPPDITDDAWNSWLFDVTPYKSSAFRVRFGVENDADAGIYPYSGWNLDDVKLSSGTCPP